MFNLKLIFCEEFVQILQSSTHICPLYPAQVNLTILHTDDDKQSQILSILLGIEICFKP